MALGTLPGTPVNPNPCLRCQRNLKKQQNGRPAGLKRLIRPNVPVRVSCFVFRVSGVSEVHAKQSTHSTLACLLPITVTVSLLLWASLFRPIPPPRYQPSSASGSRGSWTVRERPKRLSGAFGGASAVPHARVRPAAAGAVVARWSPRVGPAVAGASRVGCGGWIADGLSACRLEHEKKAAESYGKAFAPRLAESESDRKAIGRQER